MPYKITMLRDSPESDSHDQTVTGSAIVEEGNLMPNLLFATHIWVTECRSIEVSYVSGNNQ